MEGTTTNTKPKSRTVKQLIKNNVFREDMNHTEEKRFVKYLYDLYEHYGFVKYFCPTADLCTSDKPYIGKPFIVKERCLEGKEFDLESLPAWIIQFNDGHEMIAYPEEICLLNTAGMNAC